MELSEEDLMSEFLEVLKSKRVLEQLRLKCIADFKKTPMYIQMKERLQTDVTNRMPSDKWTSDNTFREQAVEDGVMASNMEQVVDAVVAKKLDECVQPMFEQMMKEYIEAKASSRHFPCQPSSSKATADCGLKETQQQFVRTICDDTKIDSKKIMERGLVARSLASDSDSDSVPDETGPCDSEDSSKEDVKPVIIPPPMKSRVTSPLTRCVNSSNREIKVNPKYSSDVYYTSLPFQARSEATTSSFVTQEKRDNVTSLRAMSIGKKFAKSYIKRQRAERTYEEVSEPKIARDLNTDSVNSSVRKNSSPKKLNSRIFGDSVSPFIKEPQPSSSKASNSAYTSVDIMSTMLVKEEKNSPEGVREPWPELNDPPNY